MFLTRRLAAAALLCLPWVARAQAAATAPAASAAPAAQAASATPAPAAAFFGEPDLREARLSPSGRWLALLTRQGGQRTGLMVLDLQDWGKVAQAARFADADIRWYAWVDDERLVFNVIDSERGSGDQRHAPGLFSVRRDGSELRTQVQLRGQSFIVNETQIGRAPLPWHHVFLQVPDDGSGEVVIGDLRLNAHNELESIAPLRLNLDTRRTTTLAAGAPDHALRWWLDPAGRPQVVATLHQGRERLYRRAPSGEGWQPLAEHDALRAPYAVHSVDAAGEVYVTVAEGAPGTTVLKKFDLDQRRPVADALVRTPGFDFHGSLVAGAPGGPALGVRLTTDAETTVWFDARMKALQDQVDQRLPGRVNRLSCRRCGAGDVVLLVESWSDRDPGQVLVYHPDKDLWRMIGKLRPAIDPRLMGERDFSRIRARDGLELPVWTTFPPGPRTPRPAVVLVHGGPWVRGGDWRWSAQAQFLASRGYVVIEPMFRGGLGFGRAHFAAGLKQWGLAMQDDLADALLWAVKQGWVDARRACIAGGSYGGYATLMGLARHPELYRCGAAWVAVTDPRLMFEWSWISDQNDEVRQFSLPALVGDPVKDAVQLRATAPVEQAARIKAPVLLVMGAQDARVPLAHGTRMREALQRAGNEPEWWVYADEGHSWQKLETRIDFAQRLERFLAQQLK